MNFTLGTSGEWKPPVFFLLSGSLPAHVFPAPACFTTRCIVIKYLEHKVYSGAFEGGIVTTTFSLLSTGGVMHLKGFPLVDRWSPAPGGDLGLGQQLGQVTT